MRRLLITGAGGYLGSLLTTRLAQDPTVCVVATDQHPVAPSAEPGPLIFEQGQLQDTEFVAGLRRHLPLDAVIHTAFRMRAGYGHQAPHVAAANIAACRNVFDFCFEHRVPRLIYFSSAAAYGAQEGNVAARYFREDEPLREMQYSYGVQKREVEEWLYARYHELQPDASVVVLRPCSVTGPIGQRSPNKRVSLIAFLRRLLPVIPFISTEWARQFLHEDDLVEVVRVLLSAPLRGYEVFNLAPDDHMTASDIAAVLRKRTVRLPVWVVSRAFDMLWHVTRGGVPMAPGSINSFRYPINMDGNKVKTTGFAYRYGSKDALLAKHHPLV